MTAIADRPLAVRLPTDAVEVADRQRRVLATLPARFGVAADGEAEVEVIAGRPGWCESLEAALDSSPAAAVIVDPSPCDPERLGALRRRAAWRDRPVFALRAHRLDEGVAHVGELRRASGGRASISVLTVLSEPVGPDLGDATGAALLDQLALLDDLGRSPVRASGVREDDHYLVGDAGLTLATVASGGGDPRLVLEVDGVDQRWRARFDDFAPAAPARLELADSAGWTVGTTPWESPYRRQWQALHARLCERTALCDDLARLESTMRTAAGIAWH